MDHTTNASQKENEDNIATDGAPPRKKLKSLEIKNKKKPKAALCLLPQFPLDILYEIFSHLTPPDLLHLIRCTKPLRRVLLTKSALSVWRMAYYTSYPGIPPCPTDVSLPNWSSLCFDTFCQNCSTKGVRRILFLFRLRLCIKCIKALCTPKTKFDSAVKRDRLIMACIPFETPSPGETYCLTTTLHTFLSDLKSIIGDRTKWVKEKRVMLAAQSKISQEFTDWHDELKDTRISELDSIREKRIADIWDNLAQLGYTNELNWLKTQQTYRYPPYPFPLFNEHPKISQPRCLTPRIWQNMKPTILEYMTQVRTEITHQTKRAKDERIKSVLGRLYRDFRIAQTIPQKGSRGPEAPEASEALIKIFPTLLDIYQRPDVRDILDRHNKAEDGDGMDYESLFEQVFVDVGLGLSTWRDTRIHKLSQSLYDSYIHHHDHEHGGDTGGGFMELAICVVSCSNYGVYYHDDNPRDVKMAGECMWYPHFIHDMCTTRCGLYTSRHGSSSDTSLQQQQPADDDDVDDVDDDPTLQPETPPRDTRFTNWNSNTLSLNHKGVRIVKNILRVCGEDWGRVTVKEMDESITARLVCIKCNFGHRCDGDRRVKVMNWRAAVHHTMKVHFADPTTQWEKVSHLDIPEILELEDQEFMRLRTLDEIDGTTTTHANTTIGGFYGPNDEIYRCVRCRGTRKDGTPKTLDKILGHVQSVHKIHSEVAVLDRDYYRGLDVPVTGPMRVTMRCRKVE